MGEPTNNSPSLFVTVLYVAFLSLFTLPVLADVPFTSSTQFSGATTGTQYEASTNNLPELPSTENGPFISLDSVYPDALSILNLSPVPAGSPHPSLFTRLRVETNPSVVSPTPNPPSDEVPPGYSSGKIPLEQELVKKQAFPLNPGSGESNLVKTVLLATASVSLGPRQPDNNYTIELSHHPKALLTSSRQPVKKILRKIVKDDQIRNTIRTLRFKSTLPLT